MQTAATWNIEQSTPNWVVVTDGRRRFPCPSLRSAEVHADRFNANERAGREFNV